MNNEKNFVTFNEDLSYVIQWLEESRMARMTYAQKLYRVNKAMQGEPFENLYYKEVESNLAGIEMKDTDRQRCLNVPEGKSFILAKAVGTIANQMASGVDTYEYQIDDKYMLVDDDTEALLAAKCEQDYIENKLELFAPTFSRDLTKYGLAAVMVKYNPKDDTNDIFRINPKNVWFDTMYTSTGRERFRGYSTMIPFSKLVKMIEHDKDEINLDIDVPEKSVFNKADNPDPRIKVGKKKITDLNDLAIYIEDLNKLASSPSLQGNLPEYWEYAHDLRDCYNLNWYRTFATDPEQRTKNGYHGDDVELTVIYDLNRKIEFKIINRRFVISANKRAFRRNIAFPITNPITNETTYRIDEFCLDCPLKFQFCEQENRDAYPYPTSPLFALLPLHDRLCSWRAKREHVAKLLSILRIESTGADAETLRKTLNLMGVILDDMQGEINSINFAYDFTPIDTEIAYLENTIKEQLNSYTQFDAMQAMGDRASAAESGMAVGAIAQGLATHQNSIMALYADIARQCLTNRVAYSTKSEFPVNNYGGYATITIQQMALNAVIRVKSSMAKKVAERTTAANALSLLGTMKDVIPSEVAGYLAQQALLGQMPRKFVSNFLKPQGASKEEIANAILQAQNTAQMLQQNQDAYAQNPLPYETQNVMDTLSPEQIDQVISGLEQTEGPNPDVVAMENQEPGLQTNLEGLTPESGAELANPNSYAEQPVV